MTHELSHDPPEHWQRALPVSNGTLGMWLFLSTEAMFFTAIFSVWWVLRSSAGTAWPDQAMVHVDFRIGLFNTLLLVASGLTAFLAAGAGVSGRTGAARLWILATMGLGGVFLGIKAGEFSTKQALGLVAVDGTRSLRDRADAVYVSSVQEYLGRELAPESGRSDAEREELTLIQKGLAGWTASQAGQAANPADRQAHFDNLAALVFPHGDIAPARRFLDEDLGRARTRKLDLAEEVSQKTRVLAGLQEQLAKPPPTPATDTPEGKARAREQATELKALRDRAAELTLELSAANAELVQIGQRLQAGEQFASALTEGGLNRQLGLRLPVALPGSRMWSATWLLMTGMHALHMLAGMVIWAFALAIRGPRFLPLLENAARYWHFVDGVWLLIFPVLYLF